jgi:hypothetical protein
VRRVVGVVFVAMCALATSARPLAAQPPVPGPGTTLPPVTVPIPLEEGDEDQGEVVDDTIDPNAPEPTAPPIPAATTPIPTDTSIPAGCDLPIVPSATFLGVVVGRDEQFAEDARTARFKVSKLEQGTLEGYQVGDLVDIDFGRDYRFLEIGKAYRVTAEIDAETQRMSSRARPEAPLFGGDQVVGIDDLSGVICPEFPDPIITVLADGSTIDTGVLSPFLDAKGSALERIIRPIVAALAGLAALVFLKRIVVWFIQLARHWWLARSVRQLAPQQDLAND